jgi:hypothetical protein
MLALCIAARAFQVCRFYAHETLKGADLQKAQVSAPDLALTMEGNAGRAG